MPPLRRRAVVRPVPAAREVFTTTLLRSRTVEAGDEINQMPELPKLAPVLLPFRYTELNWAFTMVPPARNKPARAEAALLPTGAVRSPTRLLVKFTVLPPPM